MTKSFMDNLVVDTRPEDQLVVSPSETGDSEDVSQRSNSKRQSPFQSNRRS